MQFTVTYFDADTKIKKPALPALFWGEVLSMQIGNPMRQIHHILL